MIPWYYERKYSGIREAQIKTDTEVDGNESVTVESGNAVMGNERTYLGHYFNLKQNDFLRVCNL